MVDADINGCLGAVLGLYGYNSYDQQSHFIELLTLSDTHVPEHYIATPCLPQTEYETHDWLIKVTQEKFHARAIKERWASDIPLWIVIHSDAIITHSEKLGMMSKTYPSQPIFDCAAIFGSTAPHVKLTIGDFRDRVENGELLITRKTYLLTGERYAAIGIDGTKQYIEEIAKNASIDVNKVTERILMEDIYNDICLDVAKLKDIPLKVIDVPRGEKLRPNTVDTIIAFLDGLQTDECQSIVFISRAPYKIGQEEDTIRVMNAKSPQRRFEVIGGSVQVKEAPNTARAAYHLTMAISGALYGGFERVTMALNTKHQICSSPEYLARYKKDFLPQQMQ